MPDKKRPNELSGMGAIALISQLGIVIAAPIVVGVMLGAYLDQRFGGHGLLLIVFILLGIGGGIVGAYRIVAPYLK